MEKESTIIFKNANLGYKKNSQIISVIKDINLSFFAGDFVGVVGLNGSGKSTLLRSLAGLQPLLNGQILIDGKFISEISVHDLAKKIAIVLTERISGFNLTTYDLVASGQMPYTNSFNQLTEQNITIINAAINSLGLNNHQHKLLHELSDGLFQKATIAKALSQQTPIILLDEPSAFLDYASKHELFLLLQDLCKVQNKCILISSHDLNLLLTYCSKLLVISNNQVELMSRKDAKTNQNFRIISGGYM